MVKPNSTLIGRGPGWQCSESGGRVVSPLLRGARQGRTCAHPRPPPRAKGATGACAGARTRSRTSCGRGPGLPGPRGPWGPGPGPSSRYNRPARRASPSDGRSTSVPSVAVTSPARRGVLVGPCRAVSAVVLPCGRAWAEACGWPAGPGCPGAATGAARVAPARRGRARREARTAARAARGRLAALAVAGACNTRRL